MHPLLRRSFLHVTLLLVFANPAALQATDYYLGHSAASQSGTAVTDISRLNELSLKPGDRILFEGGDTFSGTIFLGEDDAGTSTNPILITSYGPGRATIQGGTDSAVKIYNTAGVILRNLNLVGSGSATNAANGIDAGVYLPNDTRLPFLRFEEMTISGFGRGILIWGYYSGSIRAWPGFRDVKLTGLDVHGNRANGIETWGTTRTSGDGSRFSHADFVVAHCTVSENRGDPASNQHTGSGILIGGVDNAIIEYCVAHDNGGFGPVTGGGPFGIWAWEARGVKIQYNLVYNQRSSSSLDGGAYDLDGGCSNSVVQYNYSYNNEGPAIGLIQFSGASPHVNNIVRFNISENDCRKNTQGVIYVAEFSEPYGIKGADIYGNTLFVSANPKGGKPPLVKVENNDDIANVRIRNNIFSASHNNSLIAGVKTLPGKALYQGNNYWGGVMDLAAFRLGGQEKLAGLPVGSQVDPQLMSVGNGGKPTDPAQLPSISAYLLKATSPLIGRGLNLLLTFGISPGSTDFYGVPLVGALSVGASAFPVASAPEPSPAPEPAPAPAPAEATSKVTLVDDRFTGSGSLSGRLPDTAAFLAQKWMIHTGTTTIANGLAGTNTTFRGVIQTGAADCTVATRIQLTTAATGLIVRSSDASNYFRVVLNATSLVVQKTQAGSTTTLLTVARSFALGASYGLRVILDGPSLSVELDGTIIATVNHPFNQTATNHGLLAVNSGLRYWDYFTVMR